MHQYRPTRHHRLRLAFSTALAIVFALGTGLPGTATASAAEKPKPAPVAARITFGAQPATKGAPDKRPNYRYAVTPGGTLRDQVAVRNLSTSAVTLRVYATDALNINNGGFGLLPRAQRPKDVGTWVTINGRSADGTVTVKPRSVKILNLSMKVPVNAQPGDHTGGIIVAVTTVSKNKTGTAANVELDQRVGVRLFVRVSGPLHPSLSVKPLDAHYQGILNPFGRGATNVTYRITNTGNVNMGGRQSLSVKGLVGPVQVLAVPDADMLLPGGYMDVKTSLRQTWPLVHESAQVTVKPLVLPGDTAAGKASYSAATSFWAVPWAFLVLLIVIGAGLWFSRRVRRKRNAGVVGAHRSGTGGNETGASETGASEVGINQRSAARLVASASLALAAMIATSGTATAAVVLPYTDSNATGGITLCDAHGQAVTRGRNDVSLAAMAVGGSAAVAPFNGDHRSAILTAYQPRKGVEPGNWSGQSMTGLSQYTNPKIPMVEILPRDYTMQGFLTSYSPQWDGLIQLRIYLKAPNQGTKNDTYAATSLKVTGNTWQQVGAVAGDVCKTGTAMSIARVLGLPTAAPSKRPSGTGRTASPSIRPGAGASPSAPSAALSSADTSAAATDATGSSAKTMPAGASTANSFGGPLTWALLVALLAVAAVLGWLWKRRRHGFDDGL
jgi:membrane protein implicated in regulation of membrane protease activity